MLSAPRPRHALPKSCLGKIFHYSSYQSYHEMTQGKSSVKAFSPLIMRKNAILPNLSLV